MLGKKEIESYLNFLADHKSVSASTQSTALNAIAFLYKQVLELDMPNLDKLRKVRRYRSIPVVISVNEVQHLRVYESNNAPHGGTHLWCRVVNRGVHYFTS